MVFNFLAKVNYLNEERIEALACMLVGIEQDDHFLNQANRMLTEFWFSGISPTLVTTNKERSLTSLINNQKLLANKDHYLAGIIHFEGECY
jgi:hypothetical protein